MRWMLAVHLFLCRCITHPHYLHIATADWLSSRILATGEQPEWTDWCEEMTLPAVSIIFNETEINCCLVAASRRRTTILSTDKINNITTTAAWLSVRAAIKTKTKMKQAKVLWDCTNHCIFLASYIIASLEWNVIIIIFCDIQNILCIQHKSRGVNFNNYNLNCLFSPQRLMDISYNECLLFQANPLLQDKLMTNGLFGRLC